MTDIVEREVSETSLASMIGAASLPAPIQTSLLQVGSKLLGGLLAYPTAWLRRPVQAVEDRTSGLTLMTTALATEAARKALEDPVVVEWALNLFLPNEARKARNKAKVLADAVKCMGSQEQTSPKVDDTPLPEVNDDWLNSFMRYAEDASSEQMQKIWGRILAGEVQKPGQFSKATLRTIAELDAETALAFEQLKDHIVGDFVYYETEWASGPWFDLVTLLESTGLLASGIGKISRTIGIGSEGIGIVDGKYFALSIFGRPGLSHPVEAIRLSRVGVEMATLVSGIDEEANCRKLTTRISGDGITGVVVGRLKHGEHGIVNILSPVLVWGTHGVNQ